MQMGYGYDEFQAITSPSEIYDRFGNRNYEYEAYNSRYSRHNINGYGPYLNRRNYYRNYGYEYPGYGYGNYNPYGYRRQYNMGYGYGR